MLRGIAGVVLGYLTMFTAIIVAFPALYPVLGVERLLAPGSYEAAGGWIALSFLIGAASAVAGGWVCARISPKNAAPLWLAALVLVLGILMAAPLVMNPDPGLGGPRPEGATLADALAHARQPVWVTLVNPLVGASGVLFGAGWRRRRR
jgi:hypothetical protein